VGSCGCRRDHTETREWQRLKRDLGKPKHETEIELHTTSYPTSRTGDGRGERVCGLEWRATTST
jgi:hypothetical protein